MRSLQHYELDWSYITVDQQEEIKGTTYQEYNLKKMQERLNEKKVEKQAVVKS